VDWQAKMERVWLVGLFRFFYPMILRPDDQHGGRFLFFSKAV
jgi:hypothetical protein